LWLQQDQKELLSASGERPVRRHHHHAGGRPSRSARQVCETIDVIRTKRLRLVTTGSSTIDCRNGQTAPVNEAFLQMTGVFGQPELAIAPSAPEAK